MIYSIFWFYFFRTLYFIGLVYYGILLIAFLLTWIRSAYNTKFFNFIMKISNPFFKVFSGKIIIGNVFDLGATLGLALFGYAVSVLNNIAHMF